MKNKKIILVIIILLGLFLRIYNLSNVPVSPDWDEASLSYNAYSIMQTGRDEYGNFLPPVLRSFGDYKPALYSYLEIPSISIFGLNTFAGRLPGVILGLIAILALFYLVKELFKNEALALLSSFLLAISPWHMQFSRPAFEASLGLTLNLLFALFFLKSFKKPYLFFLSAFFASLSLYAYQGEKIFLPLLLIILFVVYRNEIITLPRKHIFGAAVLGFVVILPMIFYILGNSQALSRASGTSIFAKKENILPYVRMYNLAKEKNDLIGISIDNRRIAYGREVVGNYLSHFNPNWLFISGDQPRHHAPFMGLMYLFDLPFLFLGLFSLIYNEKINRAKLVVFAWLLVSPVPAAFTSDVPHAIRAINMLPMLMIVVSSGILFLFGFLRPRIKFVTLKFLIFLIIFSVFIFNFVYYLNQYFVQQAFFTAKDWQYGYDQVVKYASLGNYSKVIVSDQVPLDQSYIFFLYYLKYSPNKYQKEQKSNHSFSKYIFKTLTDDDSKEKNSLVIGAPDQIPQGVSILKTIYYPDNEKAFVIAKTND